MIKYMYMENKTPYDKLGAKIKAMRLKANETILGLAEALEIGRAKLSQIERGLIKPSEDEVAMLINRYKVPGQKAEQLWEMAGYDNNDLVPDEVMHEISQKIVKTVVVMPADARITYTDMVNTSVNNYGMVLNFMQTASNGLPAMAIARVGMSIEHARSVAKVINDTISQYELANKKPETKNIEPPKESI
jgi:transcriptional regulator with XRE-family HTH domain